MFRITSFSTPVSPLSLVVSSPYKSAFTPQANNSTANTSGVPPQRQGAKVGTLDTKVLVEGCNGTFQLESHQMLNRLFKFMGVDLPYSSQGGFDLDHVIEVARQKAENLKKSNPTVSQLWTAIAQLIDPQNHPDLTVVINKNVPGISITSTRGFADFKEFQKSTFYDKDQGYPSISIEDNYTYSAFKRGAKRAEHLKGLNSLNRLLSDYQAYLDSLKTESTPSQ